MSVIPARHGVIAASRRRTAAGTPTVLGYTTKGAAGQSLASAGQMQVSKYTLASPGTLQELHGRFVGSATTQAVRVVVYDDDGASAAPGTRLAYTSSITLPSSGDFEAVETGLSVALAAGDYYVGWICQNAASGQAFHETTGSTDARYAGGGSYSPPPTPFPGALSGSRKISCWGIVLV